MIGLSSRGFVICINNSQSFLLNAALKQNKPQIYNNQKQNKLITTVLSNLDIFN